MSGLIMRLHCRRASNGKHNAQQTNWASRSRSRSLSRCDLSQCPTACDTHRENPGLGYSIGIDDDDGDEMPLQNS